MLYINYYQVSVVGWGALGSRAQTGEGVESRTVTSGGGGGVGHPTVGGFLMGLLCSSITRASQHTHDNSGLVCFCCETLHAATCTSAGRNLTALCFIDVVDGYWPVIGIRIFYFPPVLNWYNRPRWWNHVRKEWEGRGGTLEPILIGYDIRINNCATIKRYVFSMTGTHRWRGPLW